MSACAGIRGTPGHSPSWDRSRLGTPGGHYVNIADSLLGRSVVSGSDWHCEPRCEARAFGRLRFRELPAAQAGRYRLVLHVESGMEAELGGDFPRLAAALWAEWERAMALFYPAAPVAEFHFYVVDEAASLAIESEEPVGGAVKLRFLLPVERQGAALARYAESLVKLRARGVAEAERVLLGVRRLSELSVAFDALAHEWNHINRRWPEPPRFAEQEAARSFVFRDEVLAHTLGMWMRGRLQAYPAKERDPLFAELKLQPFEFSFRVAGEDEPFFRRYPQDFLKIFARTYGADSEDVSIRVGSQYLAQLNVANCLDRRIFKNDADQLERVQRLIQAMIRDQPDMLQGYFAPAGICQPPAP
ncbi:MAG: hypothetical protein HYV16_01490 [Gammaproteobacteria bacterium]|nr:hypothetical protein [Gammaproteobacteria bacterium]